jgi:hypothetical protein
VFATSLVVPRSGGKHQTAASSAILPAPWRIPVTVLNGSGDINYTRQVASHVGAFGYTIKKVGRASSFAYPQTAVYFPPACEGVACASQAARRRDAALRAAPAPATVRHRRPGPRPGVGDLAKPRFAGTVRRSAAALFQWSHVPRTSAGPVYCERVRSSASFRLSSTASARADACRTKTRSVSSKR